MSELVDRTLVSRTKNHVSTTIDGRAVLLNVESERYQGMNEVGTWIWERLEEPTHVDALVAAMAREFDVDETTSRRDLQGFLSELHDEELIRFGDASHP